MSGTPTEPAPQILGDIRQLIEQGRQQLASTVNSTLTLLYWHIGQRIRTEVLRGQRAGYGEHILSALARQLEAEYGRGFSEKNLRHMVRLAEAFPDEPTVSAARRQLSWTHLKALIYIGDPLERDFYLQMCQQEGWSTRTLQGRMDSQLLERTALSKEPSALIEQELAILLQTGELKSGLVLKDRYVLDVLGLPLGIILRSGHKKREQSELLELDASGIHLAGYPTALPSKEVLQAKLHEAIALSRARLENRSGGEA